MGTEIKNIKKLSLLLEAISEEVIDRENFWKANSVNYDIGVEGVCLSEQLDFVNKTLFHCDMDEDGIAPVEKEGCVADASWVFALLYDTAYFKKMVEREHPEDDYDVSGAFYEGRFMGWEVKFFQTFDDVEFFVRKLAHFANFFILGFLFSLLGVLIEGGNIKQTILPAMICGLIGAFIDESHQRFVAGRSGETILFLCAVGG